MKFGLFISLILHGSILAWALITLKSTKPAEPPKRAPIVVDLATISELTKLKQGAKPKPKKKAEKKPPVKAKPLKKVSKPQPQKTAALPPPKAEPPKPDPIKELLKKKPEDPKPAKKPTPKKPVVKKKPKPKKVVKPKPKKVIKKPVKKSKTKPKFDLNSIAAKLNKIPDAKPGPQPKKKVVKKAKAKPKVAAQGVPDGPDKKLTQNEFQFFLRQIGNCMTIPAGAKGAENFRPVLSFRLNRDGSVDGLPKVVNNENSPFFRVAAEASVRAVLECQPYTLSKKKYNDWKKNKITFDLKAMIGG